MTTTKLFRELHAKDVTFTVIGGRLKYTAPNGVLNADDKAAITEHRGSLIELLQRPRGNRYTALCAAQERIAGGYCPGTLARMDSATLTELEASDRELEAAYFAAGDDSFAQMLKDWEKRRLICFGQREPERNGKSP